MTERVLFEAGIADLGIQIVGDASDKELHLSANNDWCGDTQSGFGATVTVDISLDEAEKLRDFLTAWLISHNRT